MFTRNTSQAVHQNKKQKMIKGQNIFTAAALKKKRARIADQQTTINDLNETINDLKRRIRRLQPVLTNRVKRQEEIVKSFKDAVKKLNDTFDGKTTLKYLLEEVGTVKLNITYANRKKKSKENFATHFLEAILKLLKIPNHFKQSTLSSSSDEDDNNTIEILNVNLLKFVDDLADEGLYPYFSYLVHKCIENDETSSNWVKKNIDELTKSLWEFKPITAETWDFAFRPVLATRLNNITNVFLQKQFSILSYNNIKTWSEESGYKVLEEKFQNTSDGTFSHGVAVRPSSYNYFCNFIKREHPFRNLLCDIIYTMFKQNIYYYIYFLFFGEIP